MKGMELNRTYECKAIAFNEQLPIGTEAGTMLGESGITIPKGIQILEDGSVLALFYAPKAGTVSLEFEGQEILMSKEENDIWKAILVPETPGLKAVIFKVDGVTVINPMAPIGFGWSKPMNYVDVPEKDCDFFFLKDVPHGTVVQDFYYSSVTGNYESCMLYLPPDYMGMSDRKYPVLYLQHGHGENEKCWVYQGKVNFILDNLLAEGKAVPCVIVMNNGMVHTRDGKGSPVMDSSLLEHLLVRDCIPFIEGKYRVHTDKNNRAMAGLSMGSMQTSITVMHHPDLFGYAGVFSGFLRRLPDGNGDHLKFLDDKERFQSAFKFFMRAMGTEDCFFDSFIRDNELMEEKGLAPENCPNHKIYYYPGGHEWQVWRKCIYDFLQAVFR